MGKSKIEITSEKQEKCYNRLVEQIDATYNNKGKTSKNKGKQAKKTYNTKVSKTDRTERSRMHTVARILSESGVQNIKNLDQKRFDRVVFRLKEAGYPPATIKNIVAAVQNFNENNVGNILKSSDKMFEKHGIEQRKKSTGDRSWSNEEYKKMVDRAYADGRKDVALALKIARNIGLRVEEIGNITVSQLEIAISNGSTYHVRENQGKGGKPRDAVFGASGKKALIELLKIAKQDGLNGDDKPFMKSVSLLVGREGLALQKNGNITDFRGQIESMEHYLANNRDGIQDADRLHREIASREAYKGNIFKVDLTFHGLRHNYAENTLNWLLGKGIPKSKARDYVSNWLGHGDRRDINTYLKRANGVPSAELIAESNALKKAA